MTQLSDSATGEMPEEIDFSGGQRGKFFRSDAAIRLPVYLDSEIQAYLSACADEKGIAVDRLVNDLLRKDIELIESVK